jgi:hypothetical protein
LALKAEPDNNLLKGPFAKISVVIAGLAVTAERLRADEPKAKSDVAAFGVAAFIVIS